VPLSAVDAITPAMNHTQLQLFKPFRLGQRLRLAFVGLFAGESGSCNGGSGGGNTSTSHTGQQSHLLASDWWTHIAQHPMQLAAVIVAFALVLLVLIFVFGYIGSVMRFVLFDSVVRKECHVRKGWRERKHYGWRYFLWRICFQLIAMAFFVVLLGVPALFAWMAGWFNEPGQHLARTILMIVGFVCLFLALLVVAFVIEVMTKDFVVPIMAIENVSASDGWRKLLAHIRPEKSAYAGYIGMKILLAIAAALAFGIVTLIVVLIVAIPIVGGGVVGVLMGKAAGWTWNAGTIALVVISGMIALAALVFVVCMISVPMVVFFPAYSIYFFAARFPPLADVMWPLPPPSTVSDSPPPEPPPAPPMPAPAG
jgi:hypothetical protein